MVSKDHLERSHQMLIHSLNTIGSQQESLATWATSYLMKFLDHITNGNSQLYLGIA
jgi:hypothetical protein